MEWLKLPEPRAKLSLAFNSPAGVKAWLSAQPQAHAQHMLTALAAQVEALDASTLAPPEVYALLEPLLSATIPLQDAVESRYTRKPLPLPEEDERAFDAAQNLWLKLGVAYLRIVPGLPAAPKHRALHRAANTLRLAQYCHYSAARSCPQQIIQLIFGVLAQAAASRVLNTPLVDPHFPHLGEAHLSGLLAWSFLLHTSNPYRLSAAQLTVANRALSRWRELATFIDPAPTDPQSRVLDLARIFAAPLPAEIPPFLEVRKVRRKILQRVEALKNGETPESLKLGRELSGHACIRLLRQLESALKQPDGDPSTEVGEIEIAFGSESAFAVFKGDYLNPPHPKDKNSSAIAHQRMAIFGFDRLSSLPTAIKKLDIPSETWSMIDGRAIRPPDRSGERRASPCLIVSKYKDKPRLGVLSALQTRADHALLADLDWYDGEIQACFVRQAKTPGESPSKLPVFLIQIDKARLLIAPPQLRITPGNQLTLEGSVPMTLTPGDIVERGADFVRYAVH